MGSFVLGAHQDNRTGDLILRASAESICQHAPPPNPPGARNIRKRRMSRRIHVRVIFGDVKSAFRFFEPHHLIDPRPNCVPPAASLHCRVL